MTADADGNDIKAVGVPVTGRIAFAPYGTTIPTPAEGADPDLELDPAFVPLGLLKEDGGLQFAWAPDGDSLKFWQDTYEIPSGLATTTISVTAAEILNDLVREIISGVSPDVNGYLEIDGGGNDEKYVVYTEEIFANGAIRRRIAPNVGLTSTTEDRSTRGSVNGTALLFNVNRHADVGNKHFGEWVLPAEETS
jgi:hypothetical protein